MYYSGVHFLFHYLKITLYNPNSTPMGTTNKIHPTLQKQPDPSTDSGFPPSLSSSSSASSSSSFPVSLSLSCLLACHGLYLPPWLGQGTALSPAVRISLSLSLSLSLCVTSDSESYKPAALNSPLSNTPMPRPHRD